MFNLDYQLLHTREQFDDPIWATVCSMLPTLDLTKCETILATEFGLKTFEYYPSIPTALQNWCSVSLQACSVLYLEHTTWTNLLQHFQRFKPQSNP